MLDFHSKEIKSKVVECIRNISISTEEVFISVIENSWLVGVYVISTFVG